MFFQKIKDISINVIIYFFLFFLRGGSLASRDDVHQLSLNFVTWSKFNNLDNYSEVYGRPLTRLDIFFNKLEINSATDD